MFNSFQNKKQKAAADEGDQSTAEISQDAENVQEEVEKERVIVLRPLNKEDFREAKNQVPILFNLNCMEFSTNHRMMNETGNGK